MSRIGKKPVKVPSGVKVELKDSSIKISSSSASLTFDIHPDMKVEYDVSAAEIRVNRPGDGRLHKSLHGTTRAIIANMVEGVVKGFRKNLEIYGTGYGVKVQGKELVLSLGFAAPASIPIPDGINVDIKTPNARGNDTPAVFSVSGPDKHTVGQFASNIRRARPPEPYLGKGIRYADEVIRRKVGKAFASSSS
jgi:large subunit ribosomal protein L6